MYVAANQPTMSPLASGPLSTLRRTAISQHLVLISEMHQSSIKGPSSPYVGACRGSYLSPGFFEHGVCSLDRRVQGLGEGQLNCSLLLPLVDRKVGGNG